MHAPRRVILGLAGTLLMAGCSASAEPEPSESSQISATRTVDDLQAIADAAGNALIRVSDDQGVVTVVAGEGDQGAPIEPDDAFGIFSTSKMITAATILRLVDQGLLGLDDLLADHVDFEVATPITIRHLLQHTSGIPDDWSIYESCDPDEVLADLAALAADPSNPDPGSTSEYSTNGFNLLSLVMSSATGLGAAEVLRQEIFDPLAMTSSFFTGAEDGPPLVVGEDGWRRDCPVDEEMGIWTGGGYASSAADLDTFLRALFQGDLLAAGSLTEMTTVGSNVFGFDYGLGLAVFTLPGSPDEASYGHWGEVPGWQAGGLYDAEAERSIVVLVEGDRFQPTAWAAAAWASGDTTEEGESP